MKELRIIFVCLVLVAAVVILPGAGSIIAGAQEGKITDEEITRQVESELLYDPGVASHLVDVKTYEGVVTLSGSVDNILAKERAGRISETVKGARSVVNEIEVRPLGRGDMDIRRDIEKALQLDPAADSYEVTVRVEEGSVTLTGQVDSWAEKSLAGRVAKGVAGVKEVDNVISVVYKKERPDFEIKSDIQQKLEKDIYVASGLIDISVNDGDVTLSGSVGSAFEKTRAVLDSWVAGVESVNDQKLEVVPVFEDKMQRKGEIVVKGDEKIEQAVKDTLKYDPRVNSFDIDVSADEGVVTLRGKVDNFAARRAATRDVRNTAGVVSVINFIKVRPLKAPDDAIIAGNVRSAMEWDPYLEKYEISVTVRNQKAYLYGVVDTYFEKRRASDVASRVFGVADVQNNLTVSYVWPLKSDKAIKRDVQDQLFWSLLVDSTDIQVEVDDGTVTLKGQVYDWAELDAAVQNAFEGGAYKVESELNIKGQEETYPAIYDFYDYYWWMD
ncbi:MAG: BON domain-containing protein [Candidatus Omnitrophica bacterium]|nr:BON domain-containing protein [Candidatus Omnitrophota bacterium]